MKNNSHSPVTEMLSGKNKIWLMIGLALISIADLSACIALWAFGAEAGYWFVTFMMTVVDVLYLLGVALSNQRFKYARLLFIVYIAVSALFILIWLCETLLQNEVTFDNVTVVIWSLLHAVGIVAAVITYIYAARCLRGGRAIQLGLAVAFSAMALVLVVYYGISIGHDGYFGQGGDTLPLVYEYIGDNECEVTGIVYGKGDRVVVPYEFNGRKVTKVSANVFTYANVKSVTLNCDSDVALCDDISKVSSVNRDITIYVDKKYVDVVKGKLYGTIRENDYYWHSKLELGNNVSPINLDKDEVYITFDYDSDSYKRADATVIPTWYGKKGETFKLSDVDGIDYAQHADAKDDDDLFYCYDNGGYIMSELKGNGAAINGATITQSFSGVPVRFQRVYKVFAGESNDKMYKTANHFEFSTVGGEQCDYKLPKSNNSDEIIAAFDRGEVFTRTMQYVANNGSYQSFTSLSEVLRKENHDVTIAPYWELVPPQVSLSPAEGGGDVVYGDDFTLTATVTHPLDGAKIEYEWYDETLRIGMEQDLEQNAKYVGVNKYTATVKVSAPQITSCISANAAEISINVLKRPLTVKWTDPEDNVYDGNTKYITAELLNTLENDYIGLSNSQYSQISASTYTYSARLSGFNSNNYYIAEGETHTFTILPRPVALTWDEQTEFEYDGEEHSPTAYAFDLSGGKLGISYYGARTEAGENYTVTATITDSNYVVDESSADTVNFKIKPKQVDVTWGNTELTYNGQIQAPTARAVGVSSVLVKLSVTGEQIDANLFGDEKTSTYTAVAASADSNYTVNPETASVEFTIVQRTVTVMVGGITIEYGESFKYEYVVDYVEEGIIAGDDVKVNLSVDYTPDENGNIPVGEYDIIVKLSGEDSKYYILNVERQGKLTVIAPEQEEEE